MQIYRSSHPELFCKKGVLRNFAKFTAKRECQKTPVTKKNCTQGYIVSKNFLNANCCEA